MNIEDYFPNGVVEFDVETDGFQPHGGKEAFMFIFWEGEGEAEVLYPFDHQPVPDGPIGRADRERIQWWFDRAKQVGAIRAWNGKFDRAFADTMGFDIPGDGMWHDGMVTAHTLRTNPKRSVALKAQADDLFPGSSDLQKQLHDWLNAERRRRAKVARETGTELVEPTYRDVPLEIIVPYGREDCYLTRKVGDIQYPLLLSNDKMHGVYEFERKVFDALYAVEMRGLPADRRGYSLLEPEVLKNVEELRDRCIDLAQEGNQEKYEKALKREASLDDFNPQAPQQVLAALHARGADLSYMSVEDGKVKCDKENLEAVDDELAAAILEFRSEKKVHSTYVKAMIHRSYDTGNRYWKEPFIAPDGRIHATYRQLGAITGRMSCADPNIQNQPRDDLRLRYNIKADPGYKLVTCDLSNIEMRLFAAYAGPGKLLNLIRSDDADVHAYTARALGITDRVRAGGWVESARQRAKVFNFSVIYGGGFRTIRRQQRCDMATARKLKNKYYDTFPEVKTLQERIETTLDVRGYIQTLYGRRIPGTAREAYKYVNYLVQGTAAEILKEALVSCHEDGIPVVALVHDEIIAHVPEAEAEAVQERIIHHLTQAARPGGKLWDASRNAPVVPLEAEGDIVDRWSQAKDKDFMPEWAKREAA